MKWEQEQVARKPPSFTSFMPRRLISRYPLMAFFTEFLDFVNAGGSRITTSYFSPCFSNSGRSSNTSRQMNFARSCTPFSSAFFAACITASSDASTPVTSLAPATAAFSAKDPVWVKQSRTLASLHSF